mmetsp:Transcript_6980/g.21246  ORF Transcript_6980/g.21246 Transcript_6980/m.21246 type:complete len:279 (+) Transcript_6980:498-1334(+)
MLLWPVVLNDSNGEASEVNQGAVSTSTIAEQMQSEIKSMLGKFMSEDGKSVAYDELGRSAEFQEFKNRAGILRRVRPQELSRDARLAFFLNVYNTLTVHAITQLGPPKGSIARLTLSSNAKYDIGGHKYSLHDIEDGILRGNRPSPFDKLLRAKPIGRSDPRLQSIIDPQDPRIHFALNCGAVSCPPIRFFTSDNLETALRGALNNFLQSSGGLVVAESSVWLSSLFDWYSVDFQPEPLQWILQNADLPEVLQVALERAIASQLPVKWLPYDWKLNDK